MRKLINWIINILALVFGLLLLCSYISRIVSPEDFWPISFLGLIFPVLLIINIILLVLLILNKSKFTFVIVVILILGWKPIQESFQLFSKKEMKEEKSGVRIMSYNAQVFDYFRWKNEKNSGQMLLDYVSQEQPDIICFQEFLANKRGNNGVGIIQKLLDFAPNKLTNYIYKGRSSEIGMVIFSKYPVVNTDQDVQADKDTYYHFADVKINNDTIRVFNVHLESNRLSEEQVNLLDSLIITNPKKHKTEYFGIIQNLKASYIKRAGQAKKLREKILNSPYPVIVAGDFNDTPISFAYRTISNDLEDAFVSSGRGMGATYKEFKLPLRIDYLLHSPEIKSSGFTNHNVGYSDHRPIEATFWINGSEGKRR